MSAVVSFVSDSGGGGGISVHPKLYGAIALPAMEISGAGVMARTTSWFFRQVYSGFPSASHSDYIRITPG